MMLLESEILEIREELMSSKRPLIFFDDDTDGLGAFLIFYKFLKGYAEDIKGIPVKDSPELKNEIFLRKIEEFQPDKIFILDKPLVHQDFLDKIKQKVIWLDHHPMVERANVKYYNPLRHKSPDYIPDNRPTTYWAQRIAGDESTLWIAMVGCVGDWFIPEYHKEFSIKYPQLLPKELKLTSPGTALFESKLGELCKILQFNMKCSTQQALKSIKILTRINDPLEILDQTSSQGRFIHRQYDNINETYERIKSQMKSSRGKLLLSIYEDRFAITGDLANEMQHRNPDKVVMIARRNDEWMVCSIRSQNISIKEILEKSLVGIDGHGGGHEHACGAGIKHGDFPKFIENMKKNIRAATAKKSKKKS